MKSKICQIFSRKSIRWKPWGHPNKFSYIRTTESPDAFIPPWYSPYKCCLEPAATGCEPLTFKSTPKPLTLWITTDWKILKEMGIPDHLTCLLRNLYAGQELDMEQQTGSKSGKEYIKAVYCHPAYLTYRQSTSCEMLGWMKHKLESGLPGEMSITWYTQITPPLWQKAKKN